MQPVSSQTGGDERHLVIVGARSMAAFLERLVITGGEIRMAYVDRPLEMAEGLNRLSTLLGNSIYPAFSSLAFIFPSSNSGSVGVGESSMAALPANAYAPGTDTTYPPAAPGQPWQAGAIYFWCETAGDVVNVRGNTYG
jgi:hypothetical protein